MLLLAWNIRQGGGSRLARIADALARQDADILVLSEYRGGEAAMRLLAALDSLGYRHVTKLAPPPNRSGVLIASRFTFYEHGAVEPRDQPGGISSGLLGFEWISAQAGFAEGRIRVERRHLAPTGISTPPQWWPLPPRHASHAP